MVRKEKLISGQPSFIGISDCAMPFSSNLLNPGLVFNLCNQRERFAISSPFTYLKKINFFQNHPNLLSTKQ
jgi:hypothetical protein